MSQTNGTFSSHFLQFQYFIGSCVFCPSHCNATAYKKDPDLALGFCPQCPEQTRSAWLKPWPCIHALSSTENGVHQSQPISTPFSREPGPKSADIISIVQRTTSTKVSLYQLDKLKFSLCDHQQSCLLSTHRPHSPRA